MVLIIRESIRILDKVLRHALGVFEFCDTPDCLLRVRVTSAAHALLLADRTVSEGAPVLELHLWNEHMPPLPPDGHDLAWAAQTWRKLLTSFHTLADQIPRDQRFTSVQAVGGISILPSPDKDTGGKKLFQRLGFTVFPYHNPLGCFGEFWENLYTWWIMWAYNPVTLRHRRLIHLHRSEIWMSIEEFLSRYGESNKRTK
jgi:hypothetical protein